MSQISDLKENPQNNVNLIEVLQNLYPDVKTKYYDLLIRLIKIEVSKNPSLPKVDSAFQSIVISSLKTYLDTCAGEKNRISKFIEYNEKNSIPENDLSKYKGFNDITEQVKLADEQEELKKLEAQVIKILDDSDWLVVKPLTHVSSKKYGSGTKWCTTMENDPKYFNSYCKEGVLIYCLNKKDKNKKVACHKKIGGALTFWDVTDNQIDSLEANLPDGVLSLIRTEVVGKVKTNDSLRIEYETKIREEERKKNPTASSTITNPYGSTNGNINQDTYQRAYEIMQRYTR
jgi:hypothetical protein